MLGIRIGLPAAPLEGVVVSGSEGLNRDDHKIIKCLVMTAYACWNT